jgi:hypothetical protein
MTDSGDPPRLVDPGSPASAQLRGLIEESRADVGTDAEIRKLEAALVPMLWPWPGAPGSAGAAGSKAVGAKGAAATALKVAAGAVAVAGAGALWLATSRTPTPPPPAAPSAPMNAPLSPSLASSPSLAADAASVHTNREPLGTARHSASPLDSLSEADLLGQAQAALASDPSRALSLSEQHRRRFPRGVLVQEREVIAVEALARLGRRAEAMARGERFLHAFPSSAHRTKIESIVGGR